MFGASPGSLRSQEVRRASTPIMGASADAGGMPTRAWARTARRPATPKG